MALINEAEIQRIRSVYTMVAPLFNERQKRTWAAAEALALGRGGIPALMRATGMGKRTIWTGMEEIRSGDHAEAPERVRAVGAGRPKKEAVDPELLVDLDMLVDPATRGDPVSPLRWTSKSTEKLADLLRELGHDVGRETVARLLVDSGYSLQSTRKTKEGGDHPDRDAQFENISTEVREFQARSQPVVSVDTKKKELVGEFKNAGREWQPKGEPEQVKVYDFLSQAVGKAIPYGIYDVALNIGWVNVGIDHDTAEFACNSVHQWWREMGSKQYPDANELLIVADGGGSNGTRCRLWKIALQDLADKTGLMISVSHLPPGTSKWNKIEHRMFCHITQNWRGRPLTSYETVINLIANTTTRTGLKLGASLDTKTYPTGKKVTDDEMAKLQIERADFHGEWNYRITPHRLSRIGSGNSR